VPGADLATWRVRTVLAFVSYWHYDGDQKLFGDEKTRTGRSLPLTCREDPLDSFRNRRLWQGLTVGTLVLTSCCMLPV